LPRSARRRHFDFIAFGLNQQVLFFAAAARQSFWREAFALLVPGLLTGRRRAVKNLPDWVMKICLDSRGDLGQRNRHAQCNFFDGGHPPRLHFLI
jgi:hypothetical protein